MRPSNITGDTIKTLERFRSQRDAADAALNKLDATAHQLALSLLRDGLTMREAAPYMSASDFPVTHMMVAYARDGGRSRKPWRGRSRNGRKPQKP